MIARLLVLIAVFATWAPAASAELLAAAPGGFNLKVVTTTRADRGLAYEAFARIGEWWNPSHTYTGNAGHLSLDLRPGGAFLEVTADGVFVKHMEVVYASPGKEIRLLGGLGPMQPMGLHGAMSIQFETIDAGTRVTMIYNVSGYAPAGLEGLASVVDRVQTDQMQRHAAFADRLAESN